MTRATRRVPWLLPLLLTLGGGIVASRIIDGRFSTAYGLAAYAPFVVAEAFALRWTWNVWKESKMPDEVADGATASPAGPNCPDCQALSPWLLGGGTQAFCPNACCAVLTWDPTRSLEEFAAGAARIDISFLEDTGE